MTFKRFLALAMLGMGGSGLLRQQGRRRQRRLHHPPTTVSLYAARDLLVARVSSCQTAVKQFFFWPNGMRSNPLHFMAWCRAGAILACVLCTVSMARAVGGTAGIDAMAAWHKRLDVLVNQATGKPYRAIIDQMRSEGMGDGVHDERPLVVHKIGDGSTVLAAPATVTLRHLSEAGDTALELFADFLSMPGHLPLTPEDWELVPTPCPGIERCLPAALDTGFSQAAHVVRRLQPADASRLRCAALCLHRCHRIDKDMAATILAQCVV